MPFVYSRKKNNDKEVKNNLKILPTYLSYFFAACNPQCRTQTSFHTAESNISNKYVKQVVLINHRWTSPTLQKGWD